MGYELLVLLGILLVVSLFIFMNRKKFVFTSFGKIFYFCMIRTRVGINLMNKLVERYGSFFKFIAVPSIVLGFIGMVAVVADLMRSIFLLLSREATMTVGLVLPIQAKGVFYVPLAYWLISVIVVMVIHEFGHGIYARLYRIPVKSTGLAFLGAIIPIIPAAFVEPDEESLQKQTAKKQLAVFSAGPTANIVTGFIFLLLVISIFSPISNKFLANDGVEIVDVLHNSPASGVLSIGEVVSQIDKSEVTTPEDFTAAFVPKQAHASIALKTSEGVKVVNLGENAKLGISIQQHKSPTSSSFVLASFLWLHGLFYWLSLLSIGVGLFNLLPIGPIDGGRMLRVVLEKFTPHSRTVVKAVSFALLAIVLSNILYAFVG